MALLTRKVVAEAIQLALPTVRELVKNHSWGPLGVVIAVDGNGLSKPYLYVMNELGPEEVWEKRWGEGKNFKRIALEKLRVSRRTGLPSRSVVATHPWLLERSDSLYQGGVAEDAGLVVACSGAHGETDEACAWVVWNCIWLLCVRAIAKMRDQGINRLP